MQEQQHPKRVWEALFQNILTSASDSEVQEKGILVCYRLVDLQLRNWKQFENNMWIYYDALFQ